MLHRIAYIWKTEWTKVYSESGINVYFKNSEVIKKNNEPFNFIIFKIVNNTNSIKNIHAIVNTKFGISGGDIINNSKEFNLTIPANDYIVDKSERGETKIRVPVNYKAKSSGTPLMEININNITIQ